MNFKAKTGVKRSFSYETNTSIQLSQWGECVYSAQSRKRLLCESMFISMEGRTSILKIVEREIVLMKPKH